MRGEVAFTRFTQQISGGTVTLIGERRPRHPTRRVAERHAIAPIINHHHKAARHSCCHFAEPRIKCTTGFSQLPLNKWCAKVFCYALRLARVKISLNPHSRYAIRCEPNTPL